MPIIHFPKTAKEKLLNIMESLKITSKSKMGRMLEVDYRQIHRWLDEGIEPSKLYRREIDDLFRQHVEITPFVSEAVKKISNPIDILQGNSTIREDFFCQNDLPFKCD